MSQITTQKMGRLSAAGSKKNLEKLITSLAGLNALHIIEYDGTDDGFKLGSPKNEAEVIGKRLNQLRSAASIVDISGPNSLKSPSEVREDLDGKL